MSKPLNILYVGGGTGGHIFPLYALHQWVKKANLASAQSLFVGVSGRIDQAIYAELGVAHVLEKLPQPGRFIARLSYVVRAWISWIVWLVRIRTYDLLVTSGGYGSLPAVMAARARGVPIIGYEPNAVTGRTMRYIGADALRDLARPFVSGSAPLIRLELYPETLVRPEANTLLICGGSQGSLSLDKLMIEVLRAGLPSGINKVIWLTGTAGYDDVMAAYSSDPRIEILAYSSDMPTLYRQSRVAIARAGASSIFELAAWGIPAVYVPLPWSADNHQVANAQAASQLGWGQVVEESDGVSALVSALSRAVNSVVASGSRPTADAAQTYWVRRVLQASGGAACA